MKSQSMQIKFDGQESQINSNTLINVLIHYNTIISVANREYGGGASDVSVKVNAPQRGSFIIDLCLQEKLGGMFSSDTVSYLSGLITIVGGVFAVYKYFKGKPTKELSDNIEIQIKGNDNTINQTILNVYNSPISREAISKSIETVNEDSGVEAFSIGGEDIETVTIGKQEFIELIYTDFDKENIPDEKNEIKNDALLTITKLSFEKGGQWQFLYNGFKIPMIVKDDILMKIIDDGERFGKGDCIRVDLQINQKFNPEYNSYENKSYRIVKFKEHIIFAKQQKLDI